MASKEKTLDLRPRVIQLGSLLEESFLTHLSTIRFSLNVKLYNLFEEKKLNLCVGDLKVLDTI